VYRNDSDRAAIPGKGPRDNGTDFAVIHASPRRRCEGGSLGSAGAIWQQSNERDSAARQLRQAGSHLVPGCICRASAGVDEPSLQYGQRARAVQSVAQRRRHRASLRSMAQLAGAQGSEKPSGNPLCRRQDSSLIRYLPETNVYMMAQRSEISCFQVRTLAAAWRCHDSAAGKEVKGRAAKPPWPGAYPGSWRQHREESGA
jgi:hypothetical protein